MKSIFTIKNKGNKKLVKKLKKGFKTIEIEETKNFISADFGESDYKEILLNGVMVTFRKEQVEPPLIVEVKHNFPYIKVHFEIEGFSKYTAKENTTEVLIENGNFNFFYLPKVNGTLTYTTQKRKSLEIVVTEKYLNKTFKNNFYTISGSFGKALQEKRVFKMFDKSTKISANLKLLINEIISCSYQKELKQVYLESKIKELFAYLFSELTNENTSKNNLSEEEYKQILEAEQVLKESLQKTMTIEKLSILTGINQSKLKRNFKLVFKEPIFTYLTSLRMEKAKEMLIENKKSISEIAYAVGYKNPQHFTVAFKKRFNYLPSDLKRA